MNPTIAINQIQIRETKGLYCLNDLHRAAGNEKCHQPSNWLNTQQTQELIAELGGNQSVKENQTLNPTSQIWEAQETSTYDFGQCGYIEIDENQSLIKAAGITGANKNQQVVQAVNSGGRQA